MDIHHLHCLKAKPLRSPSSARNSKQVAASFGARKDSAVQRIDANWKVAEQRDGECHELSKEHGENSHCEQLPKGQCKSRSGVSVGCKNAPSRARSWPNARISRCFGNIEARKIISCRHQSGRSRVPSPPRSIERTAASLTHNSVGQLLSPFPSGEPNTLETYMDCISEKVSHVGVEGLKDKESSYASLIMPPKFPTTFASNSQPVETALHFSELAMNDNSVPCSRLKLSKSRDKSIHDVAGRSLSFGLSDPIPKSCYLPKAVATFGSNSSEEFLLLPGSDVEALPLLIDQENAGNSCDDSVSTDVDSDGLSSDFTGELEIQVNTSYNAHPSTVLHRQRHKSFIHCRKALSASESQPRTMIQKYRPRAFDELVGQNIVIQELSNAVTTGKVAPVYLFQGSRGTGKTSAAWIFASALNCKGEKENKPCGICRSCTEAASGKSLSVKEVDAASNNGIEKMHFLLEKFIYVPSAFRFKILILDECHMLAATTWDVLLKILDEPPANVVFILITTNPDRLPCTVVSRCKIFTFPKIKDSDIVRRLQKLVSLEGLDVDLEALDLIASKSDGSLRDAETILDQLSLLGCRNNLSTVHELVGSAAEEKLFSLLEVALSADTLSTIQMVRELVGSGIEPLALISQLATVIMDILAGSHNLMHDTKSSFLHVQKDELDRLQFSLKVLSEAEKQLRASSSDQTTWLTAALLQLGGGSSVIVPPSCAGSSSFQSPIKIHSVTQNAVTRNEAKNPHVLDEKDGFEVVFNSISKPEENSIQNITCQSSKLEKQQSDHDISITEPEVRLPPTYFPCLDDKLVQVPSDSLKREDLSQSLLRVSADLAESQKYRIHLSPQNLEYIWSRVVDHCQSIPLRWQWHSYAELLSISLSNTAAVVHLEYLQPEHKSKGERSQKSISKIFQLFLGTPVSIKSTLAAPANQDKASNLHFPRTQPRILQPSFKHCTVSAGVSTILQPKEQLFETACLDPWGGRIESTAREISPSLACLRCDPGFVDGSKIVMNTCIPSLLQDKKYSTVTAHATFPHLENVLIHESRQYLSDSQHSHCKSETKLLDHNDCSSPLKMVKESRQGPQHDTCQEESDVSTASLYMCDEDNELSDPGREYINTVCPEERKIMPYESSETWDIPQRTRSQMNEGIFQKKIKELNPWQKYGVLICRKLSKLYAEKKKKFQLEEKCRQDRPGILFYFMPCIKLRMKT